MAYVWKMFYKYFKRLPYLNFINPPLVCTTKYIGNALKQRT